MQVRVDDPFASVYLKYVNEEEIYELIRNLTKDYSYYILFLIEIANGGDFLIKAGKWLFFLVGIIVLVSCASYLEAEPEEKEFEFDGTTLNVIQNSIPTDLFAEERENVKVVRKLHVKNGSVDADWSLVDNTLNLKATCFGLANCDARFEVYVPLDVEVLRNGKPTQLTGKAE
ncbi:hypothetical protein DUZ99_01215 [Xylanibacillus composti]|nr:hypothetical protein [Xylanibacillus composti]PAK53057.1 hypothetical protein CHH75_11580 [Paenibacillus sp. 7541]